MNDNNLINFSLFCNRTKFSTKIFLKYNKLTYEEFCVYLRKKKVCPPKESYYINIINSIELEEKPVTEEVKVEQSNEKVKEIKPKVKRRYKRKKSDKTRSD